jgi:hypothetical protein
MLTCDLLLLSEEQAIRSSHPHYLQACNNLKRGVKASLTNTFKEVLSVPVATLAAGKAFFGLLHFLESRLLGHSRLLSMPATLEAFLVALVYKFADDREVTAKVAACLAVFWSATDKLGANLVDLAKNAAVLLDRCLKTDYQESVDAKTLEAEHTDAEAHTQTKGDHGAREKIEEIVMGKKKRILLPPNLKFGYVSNKVVPIMLSILTQMIQEIDTESMNVDIEPIVSLFRKCNELSLEAVAYSDELTLMRNQLRLESVSLLKSCMKAFAGSYYDFYPIFFDDINWKAEDLSITSSILELLIDHFHEFPRNYHQTIIFEEPNLLTAIPKLLVWTSKLQVDTSTSHLLKSKKLSQNTPRLSDITLTSDWIDHATKKANQGAVFAFRQHCLTCE